MDADATLPDPGRAGATPTPSGARIGRFITVGALGSGGMGVVLEAHDPELDRRVAIKLLRPELGGGAGGELGRTRLQREAQAMARLSHPNVVAVYEVGRLDDQTFIAMELVDGATLRTWLREPRPWRAVVAMFVGAGRGLAAAHTAGLVHRDFKPENVLVGSDGRARVTDFGLVAGDSRRVDELPSSTSLSQSLTLEGSALGTPAYMSPEHWAGAGVDARSDQFSFCVALWEALFGRRPFGGEGGIATLRAAVSVGRIAPPPTDRGVPRAVEQALRRGLSVDPGARWPDLPSLLGALEASLVPRRRGPWIAAAATALLAIGGVAAVRLGRDGDAAMARPPAPPPASTAPPAFALVADSLDRLTFEDGCEEAPSLSPDGRTVYYDATVGPDLHLFALDLPGGAPRELTHTKGWDLSPKLSPDGTRLAFLRATADLNMSLVVGTLDALDAPRIYEVSATRPFWDPDGKHVWSGFEQLIRYDVATGGKTRVLKLPAGHAAAQGIALPDGRVVALTIPLDNATMADAVLLYPAEGDGAPVVLRDAEHGYLWDALALLPGGDAVAVGLMQGNHSVQLWRIPLDGSAATMLIAGQVPARNHLTIRDTTLVWSDCSSRTNLATLDDRGFNDLSRNDWSDWSPAGVPGSNDVYFVSDRTEKYRVYRNDRTRTGPATLIDVGDPSPHQLAVSADGKTLAFADRKLGIFVVPSDASAPPRLIAPDLGSSAPTLDRTGHTVYLARPDGKWRYITALGVDGSAARRVVADKADAPAASPVADQLAYLAVDDDGERAVPTLLDLKTGKRRAVQPGTAPALWDELRWSPDGKRLLLVRSGSGAVEIDVATGKQLREVAVGADNLLGVTYSGDHILVGRSSFTGDLWTAQLATAGAP